MSEPNPELPPLGLANQEPQLYEVPWPSSYDERLTSTKLIRNIGIRIITGIVPVNVYATMGATDGWVRRSFVWNSFQIERGP